MVARLGKFVTQLRNARTTRIDCPEHSTQDLVEEVLASDIRSAMENNAELAEALPGHDSGRVSALPLTPIS
jgi:hypothetical protein